MKDQDKGKTHNFFYHDRYFFQKWIKQRLNKYSEKTDYGILTKERYPFGFRAAFIMVDHCDFDTAEKVEAIFYGTNDRNNPEYGRKGIIGTGLKITKTVFTDASGSENIGLENQKYHNIIQKLYKDGIEIAPHSLRPKTALSKDSNIRKLDLELMNQFKCQTWIDHGYHFHNITRFGTDKKSEYFILDELLKYGYNFFWTRIDYSLNPPTGALNVNSIQGRAGIDYLKKLIKLINEKISTKKIIFYFFWDFIGCLIGWKAKDDFRFSIDTIKYKLEKIIGKYPQIPLNYSQMAILRWLIRLVNPFFYLRTILNFFYPEPAYTNTDAIFPFEFNGEVVYLFSSLWVNDCVNCYSPQNIDKLISEKGLHIGHNYLCVDEKHYLNLSFEKEGNNYQINNIFQKNLEYIAQKQKEKKLLVETISGFGSFFKKWTNVSVEKSNNNIYLIKNNNDEKIEGFTFSIKEPNRIKILKRKNYKTKNYDNCIYIWVDLFPKEEVILEIIKNR